MTSNMEALGTLEFSSALNGDELYQVMSILRRFLKTVNKERKAALIATEEGDPEAIPSENEDSDKDSDEDSDSTPPPTKKAKTESWKLDTNSYNVPFIGTSTHKGPCGTVIQNSWPTGFLSAYLDQSPYAIELLGNVKEGTLVCPFVPPNGDLQKQLLQRNDKAGRIQSIRLHTLFLQSLSELLTCAIPLNALKNQVQMKADFESGRDVDTLALQDLSNVKESYQELVSFTMKNHFHNLLQLLNEITKGGMGEREETLAVSALMVLSQLASSSIGTAREVASALDSQFRDGVLTALLTKSASTPKGKAEKSSESKVRNIDDTEQDVVNQDLTKKKSTIGLKAACMHLASTLLETNDSVVVSYVLTSGSKESKTKPGIVFKAIKKALSDEALGKGSKKEVNTEEQWAYFRLIRNLRHTILASPNSIDNDSSERSAAVASHRTLFELLKKDSLDHLARISLRAPDLDDTTKHILSPEEKIAMESQYIIQTLLCDKNHSPFLAQLSIPAANNNAAHISIQVLIRSLRILASISSMDRSTSKFIVKCFGESPMLLPHFLSATPVPDSKPTFSCIASYAFFADLVDKGPTTWNFLHDENVEEGKASGNGIFNKILNEIMPKKLTKNLLTKTLQSKSALFVSEGLKLIATILRQFQWILEQMQSKQLFYEPSILSATVDALQSRLPDFQVLLSVRTKFDPFQQDDKSSTIKSHTIVNIFFCEVLQLYASTFTSALATVQFDWIKILPSNPSMFLSAPQALQYRVLTTLLKVFGHQMNESGSHAISSSKAFSILFHIMLKSESMVIYKLARDLTIEMLLNVMRKGKSSNHEISACLNYEASLWVDGMIEEVTSVFNKLIDTAQKITVQHTVMVSHAWQSYFPSEIMPGISFSPLLSTSLTGIASHPTAFPQNFVSLTCKIATKMLLYQSDTKLSLATLIHKTFSHQQSIEVHNTDKSHSFKLMDALLQHCQDVITKDCEELSEPSFKTISIFGEDNIHSKALNLLQHSSSNLHREETYQVLMEASYQPGIASSILQQCFQYPSILQKRSKSGVACTFLEKNFITRLLINTLQQASGSTNYTEHTICNMLKDSNCSIPLLCWLVIATSSNEASSDMMKSLFVNKVQALMELSLRNLTAEKDNSEENHASIPLILGTSIVKYLPAINFKATLQILLEGSFDGAQKKVFRSVLLIFLQSETTISSERIMTHFPILAAFNLWKKSLDSDKLSDDGLVRQLEIIMSTILASSKNHPLISSTLFTGICEATPDVVVELALQRLVSAKSGCDSELINKEAWRKQSLIVSLLSYDSSIFARPIMSHMIKKQRESEFPSSPWDAIILREAFEYQDCFDEVTQRMFLDLLADFSEKSTLLMKKNSLSQERIFDVIFINLVLMARVENVDETCSQHFWTEATAFIPNLNKLNEKLLTKCIQSIQEILSLRCKDTKISQPLKNFFASLLIILCKLLPKFVKKKFSNTKSVVSEQILQTICSLLLIPNTVTLVLDMGQSSALKRMMVCCLKYGLGSEGEKDFSILCLNNVRFLLAESFSPAQNKTNNKEPELFSPPQVHDMVLSHSNFSSFTNCDDELKYALIALLVCSVSLDQRAIRPVEKDSISTLLHMYHAGVGDTDSLFRRLFYLYEINKVTNLFANEYRWGYIPAISWILDNNLRGSDHGRNWEWFIQGLEVKRIRKTISVFPLQDMTLPSPDPLIEPWATKSNEHIMEKFDDDTNDENSVSDDGSIPPSSEIGSADLPTKSVDPPPITATKKLPQDEDERYSPCFIMPLVLSVLEAFASKIESKAPQKSSTSQAAMHDNDDDSTTSSAMREGRNDEHPENHWRESFVKIAFRLSQKGVISLTLACLGSRCPRLRQVSVAVLYFFSLALNMTEAEEIKIWRERPQLAMLLNSVQRGLAVRRAMKIQAEEETEMSGDKQQHFLVSMLPTVNSLFLARSALILAKPGDDMYSSINRFFLRLNDHHGAHQDCFSLPAFISLFCSVVNDAGQARKERMWALQLIKDGTLDEFCYKVNVRRHAPTLILTSFESLIHRSDHASGLDVDGVLMLDAITHMLENGGVLSYHHLIHSVGLFSWIQGLLQIRLVGKYLTIIKRKIMELLHTALQITIQCEEKGTETSPSTPTANKMIIEPAKLEKAVVQQYLKIFDSSTSSRSSNIDVLSSFTTIICKILWSLYQVDTKFKSKCNSTSPHHHTSPHGLSLREVTSFLKSLVEGTIEKEVLYQTVGTICHFPFLLLKKEEESEMASQVSCTSLQCMVDNYNPMYGSSIDVQILKRTSFLITSFKSHTTGRKSNNDFIMALLSTRRKAMQLRETSLAWLDCVLDFVVSDDDDAGKEEVSDEDMLSFTWQSQSMKELVSKIRN